jgi:hypothetical protein
MRIERLDGCRSWWSQSRLRQDISCHGCGNIFRAWYGTAVYDTRYVPLNQSPFLFKYSDYSPIIRSPVHKLRKRGTM